MPYKKIGDYGVIGDGATVALIGRDGALELTDFMLAGSVECPDPLLLRRAAVCRGRVRVALECSPRFDYARRVPTCEPADGGIVFRSAGERLALATSQPLAWDQERTRLDLAEGEVLWFAMGYGQARPPQTAAECEPLLESTCDYWRDWVLQSETWSARLRCRRSSTASATGTTA